MFQEMRRHQLAYLALLCGLVGLAIIFMAVWPHRWPLRLVGLAIGAFYLIWGVTTHVKTQELTPQVVKEYAGMSLLATVVLWLVTL